MGQAPHGGRRGAFRGRDRRRESSAPPLRWRGGPGDRQALASRGSPRDRPRRARLPALGHRRDLTARLRASRNITRDAIVALLERAAVHEGRALRDVIAAVDVLCKGGAQAKGCLQCASWGAGSAIRHTARGRPTRPGIRRSGCWTGAVRRPDGWRTAGGDGESRCGLEREGIAAPAMSSGYDE
ncbi:uncharacterized protein SOCE26_074500 [Sorangium cellulosum]|uniref:Uncharacterized protein n=1 Tax=Sorangium cellulosum TaxID=56 RepID=A0A2L0F2Z0_SORCE|nr:uncharacterized protein SOCE26_074500 [Sorangium cellulosum]